MKYFKYSNISIPLSCIAGLSYSLLGNIIPLRNLSFKCTGINPIQVQVQIILNKSTCYEADFLELARQLGNIPPFFNEEPDNISIADNIILPQMQFMLSSVNSSFQSDRLGNLQEVQINWTFSGSRVIKDENRKLQLSLDSQSLIPKTTLTCKGKSVECANDISITEMKLSAFTGTVELLFADTYTEVDRDSWFVDVADNESYFEIDGYGKYYIVESTMIDNWITYKLSKFDVSWMQHVTKTYLEDDYTLANVFPSADVTSKAAFKYFKMDDTPYNVLFKLQNILGFCIGLREDKIYLYDLPDKLPSATITYDYTLDNDLMTKPISKVIIRDGIIEYSAGDDKGETYYVDSICRLSSGTADRLLKYVEFNHNMIILTLPLDTRLNIGSLVNVYNGDKLFNCICTEYELSFLDNTMTLELHYL